MKKLIPFFLLMLLLKTATAQDSLHHVYAKSYALEKSEQYAQAAAVFNNVYQEKSYEMNLRIGYLQYKAGAYDESIRYYTKAIELKPGCVQAKLGMVYPQSALKKWDNVIRLYEDILTIAPTLSYVSYNLGMIHYERKNYIEALKRFELVYSLYPFDYGGLLMMGWTSYRLGKKAEAKSFFMKTLLIAPEDKSAYEGLALVR